MFIDAFLGAQHAEGTELVVEDPLAEGGLDDVGAVEAVASRKRR